MASYDYETGWTRMPEWLRLYRDVDGASNGVFERLDESGIDFFFDSHRSLVGRCDPSRLSEILSGEPLYAEEPAPESPATQWLTEADLAMAVTRFTDNPRVAVKMLQAAQLLIGDEPSPLARRLGLERTVKTPSLGQRGVRRLWAFAVLEMLKALPDEHQPKNPLDRPRTWRTGGEPMTEKQREFLEALCRDKGRPFDPGLSKAAAAEQITELQRAPTVPMTAQRAGELEKLCEAMALPFNPNMSEGAAAVKIEKLKKRLEQAASRAVVEVKRARLTRDVLDALGSTHPKGTEVDVVEERGEHSLIGVRTPSQKCLILQVEAAALDYGSLAAHTDLHGTSGTNRVQGATEQNSSRSAVVRS